MVNEMIKNKQLKAEALNLQFTQGNEEAENKRFIRQLEGNDGDHLMTEAMQHHLRLVDTMQYSSQIVFTELHQRKSLKQVRGLIDSIVVKRKLRTSIGNADGSIVSFAKPLCLDDIRDLSKEANLKSLYHTMNEIYPKTGAD